MIWALLEITLPLCLSFLFGLGAGWLFWRWRRRSISQAQWNSHGAAATGDNDSELKLKSDKLEATVEKQIGDLLESEKRVTKLTGDLKTANDQLAVAKNNQGAGNVSDLQAKLTEASLRAEQQTKLTNELQQKLKQSETVTTERDAAIAKAKELEERLSQGNLQNNELEQTRSQLQTVEQKFKNFQASVVANRQTAEEETSKLLGRNQQLQEELEKAKSQSTDNSASIQRIRELESQLIQANNAASELNQAKANIASLNAQLNEARMDQSKNENNAAANEQSNQLVQQNAELRRQLEQTKNDNNELREARSKLAEVTTQLNNARARNSQLAAGNAATEASAAAPVTPISVGQIKKLQNEIVEKDQKIAALQKKASAQKSGNKSKPKTVKPKSKKTGTKKPRAGKASWQQGKTKLGTPGSNHKDDLTEINGIGPKIQKVLNRLGIKSFEQLATFRAAEVKLVDEALVDFSGRIKRDEWVPQAKAIIRNGHQPPNTKSKSKKAAAKKPKKTKSRKNAWQKGKTKFGTPGSTHRDDLKVINGIGPVIEKSLNRSGVRSWEQLATLKVKEVKAIDEALNFPGRIQREQWVQQAKALIKQFPDNKDRPTRRTYLNHAAAG